MNFLFYFFSSFILFSVWNGQDFIDDFRYAIDGPVIVRNPTDLYQLKNNYPETEVVRQFENIFLARSNLSVEEPINIIVVMRTLVKRKENGSYG